MALLTLARAALSVPLLLQRHIRQVSDVVEQITVRTQNEVKTRLDLMGRDAHGNIVCVECKSSATAGLNRNQVRGFPEIERAGATIAGRGKLAFESGTVIPPTRVSIVRPD